VKRVLPLAACLALAVAACAHTVGPELGPLETVPGVDLDRYLGR
jgi:hypothetical protein